MLDASKQQSVHPLMKRLCEAEHTVLPAGLLQALLQYRLTLIFLSSPPSRSLDDELPHTRRSRSPTRYYDAARGRRQDEEYLDDRCVLVCASLA